MANPTAMWNYWLALAISGWLAGGQQPGATPATRQPAPSVPAVVQHYANLMAERTALATPASRRFAGRVPVSYPGTASHPAGFSLKLPQCEVQAFLDEHQQLRSVDIGPVRLPEDPHRLALNPPADRPVRLVRLGELRQLFGAGAPGPYPALHQYHFTYQPAPARRALTIRAFLAGSTSADSTVVSHLTIFTAPAAR